MHIVKKKIKQEQTNKQTNKKQKTTSIVVHIRSDSDSSLFSNCAELQLNVVLFPQFWKIRRKTSARQIGLGNAAGNGKWDAGN